MNDMNNQVIVSEEDTIAYFNNLPPLSREVRVRSMPRTLLASTGTLNADDDIGKINTDAPAIVAFSDGLSERNRSAVMLGIGFAESVANSIWDIDKEPIKWLNEYKRALFHAGWTTTGGHEYGSYTTNNKSLTMDQVVMELLGSVAGPNAATVIALIGQVVDTLGKNDSLMSLFEGNSKKGELARFRMMPCLESSKGTPVTYLLSMHCQFTSSSGGILFWKWKASSLNIKRMATGVEFDLDRFQNNKQLILNHLNGEAEDFFAGLKKQ